MNKRDVIIAFLLGVICTQAARADFGSDSFLLGARIIGLGAAAAGDLGSMDAYLTKLNKLGW